MPQGGGASPQGDPKMKFGPIAVEAWGPTEHQHKQLQLGTSTNHSGPEGLLERGGFVLHLERV